MAKKQNENFYEMLEVDQTATAEEIKRSYYRLSKKYHPDINPKTANIFREINEAYETLRDPISRTLYDAKLKTEDVAYDTNDYYTKASYYKDPKKEPLKSVFEHFTEYRFETAMSAIWGRNIFLLFGNFMMFATVFTTKVTVSFINLFPVLTVANRVVTKRTNVSRHTHHPNNVPHHTTSTTYHATVEVQCYVHIELIVSDSEYGLLLDGDEGLLICQGTRCKGFER